MAKRKERDFKFQASWYENKEKIISECGTTSSNEQQFCKAVMREYLHMKEKFGLNSRYEQKHLLQLEVELGIKKDVTLKGIEKMKAKFSDIMDAKFSNKIDTKRVELIKQKIENTYGDPAFLNRVGKIPKYNPEKMTSGEDPVYANGGTLVINQNRQAQYAAGMEHAGLVDEFTKGTLDFNRIANLKPTEREAIEKLDSTFGAGFLAKNMFPLVDEYCNNDVLAQKLDVNKIQPSKEENSCVSLKDIFTGIAQEKEKAREGKQFETDSLGTSRTIPPNTKWL